jgi:hypothetical protein
LGKDAGRPVEHLILIGDPGCIRRHQAPAPRSVIGWARKHHGIQVHTWELKTKSGNQPIAGKPGSG